MVSACAVRMGGSCEENLTFLKDGAMINGITMNVYINWLSVGPVLHVQAMC